MAILHPHFPANSTYHIRAVHSFGAVWSELRLREALTLTQAPCALYVRFLDHLNEGFRIVSLRHSANKPLGFQAFWFCLKAGDNPQPNWQDGAKPRKQWMISPRRTPLANQRAPQTFTESSACPASDCLDSLTGSCKLNGAMLCLLLKCILCEKVKATLKEPQTMDDAMSYLG